MIEPTHDRIDAALTIVGRELDHASAEKSGFEEFQRRLKKIEPDSTASQNTNRSILTPQSSQNSASKMTQIQSAYVDTIWCLQNIKAEFDGSIGSALQTQFGPDLATAILQGTNVFPELYHELVRASEHAAVKRELWTAELKIEYESLARARSHLIGIKHALKVVAGTARSVEGPEWHPISASLERIETSLEEASSERQGTIHRRQSQENEVEFSSDLMDVLYEALDVSHPALADIAEHATMLSQTRREIWSDHLRS